MRVRHMGVLSVMLATLLAAAPAPAERDAIRLKKAMNAYRLRGHKVTATDVYSLDTYLCRRFESIPFTDRTIELDGEGLPQKLHPGGAYYHPIQIARTALFSATQYTASRDPQYLEWMRRGADKLLSLMDGSGALRYPIDYPLYYGVRLERGWTSGMAQGVALSALARTYQLTCDERYLHAGRKVLAHLLTPIEAGGTATDLRHLDPALSDYVWFEEYPVAKPAYTLNGFMYALLGLYDWSLVDAGSAARVQFEEGVRSLVQVLPCYDHDGFTAYDLSPLVYGAAPNFNPHYHAVHITQLSALHAITGEPALQTWAARWYAAVGGEISACAPD